MISKSIQLLEHYIAVVPDYLQPIPSDILLYRVAPGKWSKQEILGHLCDSALHNWRRFVTAPHLEGPYEVVPYLQAPLVRGNGYQEQSTLALANLWTTLNQQILEVWYRLSEKDLQKKVLVPNDNIECDLAFLINDYVAHLEHHLKQIFGSLESLQQHPGWRLSVEDAMKKLEGQELPRDIVLQERGSLVVEWYAPRGHDPQQPHQQDELYIIASGSGLYYCNGHRQSFGPGDILFAPAGVVHRFEEFTEDFGTWVIFYGPKGGEIPGELSLVYSKEIDGQHFEISTAPERLDAAVITSFLKQSYWADKRSEEQFKAGIEHAICFGLYHEGKQVGFTRVISDRAVLGYLGDVFILEEYRGLGLGTWLIQTILDHPTFRLITKWWLVTKDAHELYEKCGFKVVERAERVMELITE